MNAKQLLQCFDRISEASDANNRLRRFVLQLAVRGKLVEQAPNDERAQDLLRRIRTEKALVERKGEVRRSRAVELPDDAAQLFPIPVGWTWCRLSDVGAIVGGSTPSSADSDNFAAAGSGIPWLTPADLGKRKDPYVSRGARDLTPKGLAGCSATLMPKGSVLFTSRAPIGYTAIAANEIATNQGFKSVVPYLIDCNLYIAVYFRAFATWIDAKASGTTFREVSGKVVASLPFPLPPLAEQRRIVAKVDELIGLCDRFEAAQIERERRRDRVVTASLTRLNNSAADHDDIREAARFALQYVPRLGTRSEHVQQLRKTILNLAARGQVVRQGPNDEPASELLKSIQEEKARLENSGKRNAQPTVQAIDNDDVPFQIPRTWRWVRFGELIMNADAGWSPKSEGFPRSGDNWGVLKVSAVSWDRFLPDENKQLLPGVSPPESAQVHDGDFLISRANTSELVAKSVVVGDPPPRLILSDKIVRLQIASCCSKRFFSMINNHADYARAYYAEEASGTSLSMKNVSRAVIYGLLVPLPPAAEQRRIVAKVDELIAICDRLEAQLSAAQTQRARLFEAVLHEALEDHTSDKSPAMVSR
ncbi:MAG TPA: restriction endonuclease subunit S [Thermoanaerobaculia bacterium]